MRWACDRCRMTRASGRRFPVATREKYGRRCDLWRSWRGREKGSRKEATRNMAITSSLRGKGWDRCVPKERWGVSLKKRERGFKGPLIHDPEKTAAPGQATK